MAEHHVATARRRTLSLDDFAASPYTAPIATVPTATQLHTASPLYAVPEDVARGQTPSKPRPRSPLNLTPSLKLSPSLKLPPSLKLRPLAARLSARLPMPFEVSAWHAHWLARLRSALRLLVIVLSAAVTVFLVHTLEIFRGNRYIDLRKNELPMTWPARTNLVPTLILLVVAVGTFLSSVAVVALSFKRSFRRPTRSAGIYRVVGGCFSVLFWILAIAEFSLLDRASKASLGRYSCGYSHIMSNGRYQYRAVCEEQGVAFYLAIGAAAAELATLLTLAVTAPTSSDQYVPGPKDDHEKKRSMSYSSSTKRLP